MNNYIRYNLLMLLALIGTPSHLMYSAGGAATAPAVPHVHTASCPHSHSGAAAKLADSSTKTAIFTGGSRSGGRIPGSLTPPAEENTVSTFLTKVANNQLVLIMIGSIWTDIYLHLRPYLFPSLNCDSTAKLAALTSHVETCERQVERLKRDTTSTPAQLATAQERLEQALETQHKLLCPTPKTTSSPAPAAKLSTAHVHGPSCKH